MRSIKFLRVGEFVKPRMTITDQRVLHWEHRRDCATLGGGLLPSAKLKIVETSGSSHPAWVRLEIPGRAPPGYLKVSGGELSACFEDVT